jgi:hypothetical protein
MTHTAASEDSPVVELRAARIPFLGAIAHHHWLVVERQGPSGGGPCRDRWEVWQYPDFGGQLTAGHLHKNLLPPEAGVGSGPSWMIAHWQGQAAAALAERIEQSPVSYPWRRHYRYWPGPNSNTYVQWVLGDDFRLGRCGVGRRYCRGASGSRDPAEVRR